MTTPVNGAGRKLAWWGDLRNQPALRWARTQDVWLILLLMGAMSAALAPNFLSAYNLSNLLDQAATLGIISIGQFIVILSGGFDLSVGGVVALSAMVTATYSVGVGGASLILGVLAGALVGLVSGLAITRASLPPFIATLGMLGVARGLAYAVSEHSVVASLPLFATLRNFEIGILPFSALIWLVLAALFAIWLRRFRTGRYIAAIGGSEPSARQAGISVGPIKLLVYTASGLLAGIAGATYVIRSGSGVPLLGNGWELDSIAIVVIGGSNLFGGSGELPKTVAATIIYMMISNVMNLASVDPYFQDILAAVIIVGVVALRLAQNRGQP